MRGYGSEKNIDWPSGVRWDDTKDLTERTWGFGKTLKITDPAVFGGENYNAHPSHPFSCDTYAVAVWNENAPFYRGESTIISVPAFSMMLRFANPVSALIEIPRGILGLDE